MKSLLVTLWYTACLIAGVFVLFSLPYTLLTKTPDYFDLFVASVFVIIGCADIITEASRLLTKKLTS